MRPVDESRLTPAQLGEQLYSGNCLRCHGIAGGGVATPGSGYQGPSLRDAGALAADFYLGTGYMPLDDAHDQPIRDRSPLSARERQALSRYVASLGTGPPVPAADPRRPRRGWSATRARRTAARARRSARRPP